MGDASLGSRIARLVHSHFDALPKRSKPTIHPDGSREWVPLSGIVLVTGENTREEILTCVAIATGAKCLPSSQISQCRGMVLHDSHAEILAIRAFNNWLLEECKSLLEHRIDYSNHEFKSERIEANEANNNDEAGTQPTCGKLHASKFINWRHQPGTGPNLASHTLSRISDTNQLAKTKHSWPPFELRKDLRIYMYGTCAPCGDVSMELCMASQEDPTPWATPPLGASNNPENSSGNSSQHNQANNIPHTTTSLLNGRAHFSILGAVRRKPSRADAESTLSKSCSDKLAVKQVTSLLTFPACLLIFPSSNAYLTALLLPEEEISRVACARAFGSGETGRLGELNGRRWSDDDPGVDDDDTAASLGGMGYTFRPFEVRPVPTAQVQEEWAFGKPKDNNGAEKKSKPGNISAVWTAAPSSSTAINGKLATGTKLNETLINGVKQGYRISSPTPRKASALSRAKMWGLLRDIVQLLPSADNCGENDGVAAQTGKFENQTSTTRRALDHIHDNSLFAKMKECVLTAQSYELMKRKCIKMGIGPSKLRKNVTTDVREVLGNWVENRGDDDWGLELLEESSTRKVVERV
ncbi:tRNA-specific adenosine deaminase [Blastomyces dermatitidis ER-3]|uniref:tRNA-specific adenosine deaminase n=2 Tax=Ajellomyces dermatitidis (strain ER-3 / ATCC MYA-2586) TaxID=559297 RepID=A0ABP2EKQ3_AJEDR|nr:tRNA-specific adenosine deaminase [Blastomyces dermatitidis ER-3]EEQ83761.2 tRNA-specific adenosine deaminase [Blastomyces dermatitidis ER-3]